MDIIDSAKKEQIWSYLLQDKPKPTGVTAKRLERIKPVIFRWDFFWTDVVLRHNLMDQTPEQLKQANPEVYEHAIGNAWGMIIEALYKSGLVK